MALHTIALCAGAGMLDEGLRAGCEFLGIEQRTVCYVEREAFAAATLVGRMAEKCLDEAPVWSDLVTFNGRAWRGRVDFITAGFPCQPHSVAGSRKGAADDRWLWRDICRIIRDVSPWGVFLENVRGLLSSGGFTEVVRSLVALGFNIEWGVLAASEVGASHQRERIFILAYRDGLRELQPEGCKPQFRGRACDSIKPVDDANGSERRPLGFGRLGGQQGHDGIKTEADCGTGVTGEALADSNRIHDDRSRRQWQGRWHESANSSGEVADTGKPGLQGREFSGSPQKWNRTPAFGSAPELREVCLFAPGPASGQWVGIVRSQPFLAPAIESGVRVLADGLAVVVDESRSDQLRGGGNGVVPLQAATAFVLLARRAGIA